MKIEQRGQAGREELGLMGGVSVAVTDLRRGTLATTMARAVESKQNKTNSLGAAMDRAADREDLMTATAKTVSTESRGTEAVSFYTRP
jgi:hypothetical protein